MRIKEQETRLTVQEHDDDDDGVYIYIYTLDEYYCVQYFLSCVIWFFQVGGDNAVGSY